MKNLSLLIFVFFFAFGLSSNAEPLESDQLEFDGERSSIYMHVDPFGCRDKLDVVNIDVYVDGRRFWFHPTCGMHFYRTFYTSDTACTIRSSMCLGGYSTTVYVRCDNGSSLTGRLRCDYDK